VIPAGSPGIPALVLFPYQTQHHVKALPGSNKMAQCTPLNGAATLRKPNMGPVPFHLKITRGGCQIDFHDCSLARVYSGRVTFRGRIWMIDKQFVRTSLHQIRVPTGPIRAAVAAHQTIIRSERSKVDLSISEIRPFSANPLPLRTISCVLNFLAA